MSLLVALSLISALVQAPVAPARASVAGRVIADDTQKPLAGVEVTLVAVDDRPLRGATHTAVTDAEGGFRLDGLEPGPYHVTLQKAGYARLDATERSELSLGAGLMQMNFTLQRAAVIVGHVIDDNGNPVLGAQVLVFRRPPAHLFEVARQSQMPFFPVGQMAHTNDLGEFRMFGLPPHDEYFVHAAPGLSLQEVSTAPTILMPTLFPGTSDWSAAQPVAVGAGQTSADVVIRMIRVPAFRVSGVVVDEAGRPVADALVRLMPDDTRQMAFASWRMAHPSHTDRSGRFTLHNVTSGSYTLVTIAPRVTSVVPGAGANTGGSGGMMSFSSSLGGSSTGAGVTTETRDGITTEYRDDTGTRVPVTIDQAHVERLEITVRRPPR